jgi:hypothetical protein
MAFKNCGHKLLHLTHDSNNNNRRDEERKKERWQMYTPTPPPPPTTNNNNNLSYHTDKVTERERESDKINTAHITSPYKSSTTHKCTYYYTYMSVTATTTTLL